MITPMTGGIAGLVLGIVQFLTLMGVASHLERQNPNQQGARILRIVAALDLFIFPIAGYVIGGLLAEPGAVQ